MFDCDFIPSRFVAAKAHRRAMRIRIVGVAGLVVTMGVWVLVHQRDVAGVANMRAALDAQRRQIRIHLQEKEAMIEKRRRLDDHRGLIEQLNDSANIEQVLADISERIPDNVVLTDLAVDAVSVARFAESAGAGTRPPDRAPPRGRTPGRPRSAGASPDGPRIVLGGIAPSTPDVLRFAAALESSSLLARILLDPAGPSVWFGRQVERFEVRCDLVSQRGFGG